MKVWDLVKWQISSVQVMWDNQRLPSGISYGMTQDLITPPSQVTSPWLPWTAQGQCEEVGFDNKFVTTPPCLIQYCPLCSLCAADVPIYAHPCDNRTTLFFPNFPGKRPCTKKVQDLTFIEPIFLPFKRCWTIWGSRPLYPMTWLKTAHHKTFSMLRCAAEVEPSFLSLIFNFQPYSMLLGPHQCFFWMYFFFFNQVMQVSEKTCKYP